MQILETFSTYSLLLTLLAYLSPQMKALLQEMI